MKKFKQFLVGMVGLLLALAVPQVRDLPGVVNDHRLLVSVLVVGVVMALVMRPKRGRSAAGREVMQCGGVNITIANGNLGSSTTTDDGVCGIVMTGVTEGGGYTLGTAILVTSMVDVAAAGITVANNPFAIYQLTEFYAEAPVGAQLWVMLVANTMTVASIADKTNASGAIKLLNAAQGAIKLIGILTDDKTIAAVPITVTVIAGLNALVYTAATNLKALIADFVTAENPLRGIVGGTSYSGVPANLTTINSGTTNNRVAIVVGDTRSYDATNTGAAVGLVLGTFASIPVQQKISWVGNGERSNLAWYLNTVAITLTNGDPATIAGKGFITQKMYANKAGFFWSGDTTATASTDDYYFLARGRVVDKAQRLVYALLVNNVDATVPSVPGTGLIDPGYAADLQGKINAAINTNMTNLGNCTGVVSFVDPAQNIVSTSTLNVAVTVDVFGYSSTINVKLALGL